MWLPTRSREGLARHKYTAVAGRGALHKLLAGCEAAHRPWRPPGRDRGDPGAGVPGAVAAQPPGCRQCLSLTLPAEGSKETAWARGRAAR